MFQSLWLSVKRDACEEGFWKKAKRGLDRMTHYWTKVTKPLFGQDSPNKSKVHGKRKIRIWELIHQKNIPP